MTASDPHPLDHLVLPVESLVVARTRLERLGFTVAADARHPFGTENACIFFADGTYLEPLAVYDPQIATDAALAGNVFVARDAAFRFRKGPDGLSAIVLATRDARGDHARFRSLGLSAGDMLGFSRPMRLPDGSESTGSFRLSFAADLRSPDFFLFSCERLMPLPPDRAALERHANGVTGLSRVVLSEPVPSDFAGMLTSVTRAQAEIDEVGSLSLELPNAGLSVLGPAAAEARYGRRTTSHSRGLRGHAIELVVRDLAATERVLTANGIAHSFRDRRLVVPEAPGQGVILAFGEHP